MEEPQGSQKSTLSEEEDVDLVQHHEIDIFTSNLNFGSLSAFDFNSELHSAQTNDTYIISNVASQLGISKALEHGVKLSSIIKAKALRLNESTTLELLDVVLKMYTSAFQRNHQDDEGDIHSEPCSADPAAEEIKDAESNNRNLDFIQLSKFFSSKVICYSALNWDTIPPYGNVSRPSETQQKRRRTQTMAASHIAPRKELATMGEYHESLEIQKHTNDVKEELIRVTENGPVNFWSFVLDDDPEQGYTKTCLNIYAMTFLTVKGYATFSKHYNGEILLKASAEPNQEGENSQGIVTALSYDKWMNMVKTYRKI